MRGFAGDPAGTRAWLDTARRRLGGRFDFSPEMLTHDLAVDLGTGRPLAESEHAWSQHQDRQTLTPYLAHALRLLRRADVFCTGVTSPWSFGIQVEPEYQAAIAAAQREVNERDVSWYFLHTRHDRARTRPWVALAEGPARLVAIASTVPDVWWQTIDSPRTDRAWIETVADQVLTADGRGRRPAAGARRGGLAGAADPLAVPVLQRPARRACGRWTRWAGASRRRWATPSSGRAAPSWSPPRRRRAGRASWCHSVGRGRHRAALPSAVQHAVDHLPQVDRARPPRPGRRSSGASAPSRGAPGASSTEERVGGRAVANRRERRPRAAPRAPRAGAARLRWERSGRRAGGRRMLRPLLRSPPGARGVRSEPALLTAGAARLR